MTDISFNIASKELKTAQIAQLNQLFKLLHLVHIVCFHMTSRAAILVSQNNETAAMLVSQTNPRGVELFLMQTLSFVPINLHRCWPRE